MIKKLILGLALASCALVATAQSKAKVTLGKPYPVVDAQSKLYYQKGNEILTIKITKKDNYILQKFDASKLTFLKARVYDDFPKNAVLEKITQFKNSYYLFYSLWDGENEQLFAREIDFSKGQFKDPAKRIITVSEKLSGTLGQTGFYKMGILDKFDFFFSYDSTRMVVKYSLKPKVKDDSKNFEVVGAHVFSPDLTEHWHGKLTMPYTEKKMSNLDYSVDSHNNVYTVTKVYKDNSTDDKKRGADETNYKLEILKFSQPNGALTKTSVDLKDHFIQTVWMYENSAKNNMICIGFYNKGVTPSSADGIVMFKLGNDGKYTDLVTHPIPVAILNQNESRKAVKKNEKKEDDDKAEFESLVLDRVQTQPDGSLILMGEQYYTTYHYRPGTNGSAGSSYTKYHYEDMLVAKIEADGKLGWMGKLAKRQQGQYGQGSMSYKYFTGKGSHHFVFLDNEKNKTLNPKDRPNLFVDGSKGYMTDYVINDKTGLVQKNYLVDLNDVNGIEVYQFWPNRIIPFGNDTFIFESYKKGKEDILIRVDAPAAY